MVEKNGHIRLPMPLAEKLCQFRIPGESQQVLWAIIRFTYGWHKEADTISKFQYCKYTTLGRQNVIRGESNLIQHRIVLKNGSGSVKVNENVNEWVTFSSAGGKRIIFESPPTESNLIQKRIKFDTKSESNLSPSKDKTKDIYIKDITEKEKVEKQEKRIKFDSVPYEEIVELFNSTCPTLPRVQDITEPRKHAMNARWKKNHDIEFFRGYFKRVQESDFLSFRNKKWGQCSFDWLMQPSNMQKVIEGNYDNKRSTNEQSQKSNGITRKYTTAAEFYSERAPEEK